MNLTMSEAYWRRKDFTIPEQLAAQLLSFRCRSDQVTVSEPIRYLSYLANISPDCMHRAVMGLERKGAITKLRRNAQRLPSVYTLTPHVIRDPV